MSAVVRIKQCPNPQCLVFYTPRLTDDLPTCQFFTNHNIDFAQRELLKIGPVAEQILREILAFYVVRHVYVSRAGITVVIKNFMNWETLPDQIVRTIEKAFEEFELR